MKLSTYAILCAAVISSVLSQITALGNGFRIIMYLAWALLFFVQVYQNNFKLTLSRFSKVFFLAYMIWGAICLAASVFGTNHLSGNYLRIMAVPLVVTLIADLGCEWNEECIVHVCKIYIICAVLFGIWVNLNYFTSYSDWISSQMYAYAQKNSAAQIWISAVLMCIFLIKKDNTVKKVFWGGCAAYLIIISAFSQCRTALLALGVVLFSYALACSKHRLRLFICGALALFIAFRIPTVQDFFNQTFFITKYAGTDLNTMSSGRLDNWAQALSIFQEHPFIGIGKYYVDCSYILILAEGGIIGFALIEFSWLFRIWTVAKSRMLPERKMFLGLLIIFYILESALEGFPPFGPGVSSFMFWFLCGYFSNSLHGAVSTNTTNGKTGTSF